MKKHGITPTTTNKSFSSALSNLYNKKKGEEEEISDVKKEYARFVSLARVGDFALLDRKISALKKEMLEKAIELDFEGAVKFRDELKRLEIVENIMEAYRLTFVEYAK
ncbi:MAG: hypothetical protein EBU33_10900 [Sphingobacteriia bacterium]|nr:hypothetical protein [Sphingobacteriia bacterium]